MGPDILLHLIKANPNICFTVSDGMGECKFLSFVCLTMLLMTLICTYLTVTKIQNLRPSSTWSNTVVGNRVGFHCPILLSGQVVSVSTNILPAVDEAMLHELMRANPDFCLTVCERISEEGEF